MTRLLQLFSGLALAATAVLAIGHDEVESYEENAPSLFLKYKPWLKVWHGCVPFPAVNDDGEVGGGLKNTGASNGKCSKSLGQVYCRGRNFPDSFAMMYSWYMPKDQPIDGSGGHRHEWESIVVWLSHAAEDAELLGLSYSGHGGYTRVGVDDDEDDEWDGTRPKIAYDTQGFTNHELFMGNTKGGDQPLIDWLAMSDAARNALNTYDFGAANVPFNEKNFGANLEKAKLQ